MSNTPSAPIGRSIDRFSTSAHPQANDDLSIDWAGGAGARTLHHVLWRMRGVQQQRKRSGPAPGKLSGVGVAYRERKGLSSLEFAREAKKAHLAFGRAS